MSNYNPLFSKFAKFDFDNPNVYNTFKRYSFRAMNRGHQTISPRTIIEAIRWENPDFEVSNNHVVFYARKFMKEYPQHEGFFPTRKEM